MSVLMKSFIIQTENDIGEILKNNNVKYVENAFELKIKYMNLSSEYGQPNMDFVCSSAYINPLKIQCGSCFTLIRKEMIFCDVIFEQVENEKKVKMYSLIHQFSENDRIIVFNGLFANVFGLQHLFIRPNEKNLFIFYFIFNNFPFYKNTIVLNHNFSELSDRNVYSLFGKVIEINKSINEDNMHLRIQCHSYQNNIRKNNYDLENYSIEDIMSMVKCNCFPDLINVLVNAPSLDFTSLVPDQQIQLKNVKSNFSNFLGVIIHVKGISENLNTVPKNSALPLHGKN